jgi:hypothetical protein
MEPSVAAVVFAASMHSQPQLELELEGCSSLVK